MKWFERVTAIFLVLSVAITEYHTYVSYNYSFAEKLIYDKWGNKDHIEGIPFLYFLYEAEPFIREIIKDVLFAIVAGFRFKRIRNVLIIFVLYDFTQLGFYFWNRNSELFPNSIVYTYMVLAIIFAFIPERKGGKLVNIGYYDK